MFWLFTVIAVIFSALSYITFHKKINPITVYFFIWFFCLLLIEVNIIEFNQLTVKTWLVIIMFSVVYALAFFCGATITTNKTKFNFSNDGGFFLSQFNEKGLKQYLNWVIILSTFVSWANVIPATLNLIRTYGINLIANSNQIYQDAITNLGGANSGGLSLENFIYLAVLFSGIYVSKFGMSRQVLMALMTAILSQLTSGSRGGLFIQLSLLLGPMTLIPNGNKGGKSRAGIKVAAGLAFIFLLVITYLRKSSLVNLPYANPVLDKFGGFSSLIYNISFYFTSPIATLNEFIKAPVHTFWGASTFRPFYLLLNTFGVTNYNVDFYNIFLFYSPLPANVVSYVGELILDFGVLGGAVATSLFGGIFGVAYKKARSKYSSLAWLVVLDVCFALLVLSFFAWFLRPAYLWFSIIMGLIVAAIAEAAISKQEVR